MNKRSRILTIVVAGLAFGCAAQQKAQRTPVLYPNETMQRKSTMEVQNDVDECATRAERYVPGPSSGEKARKVALGALESAVVGAAAGAVGGAIFGEAGRGTGAGAAVGGMTGAYGQLKELAQVDPKEKGYIKNCLEEKGYRIIGWESEG